MYNPDENKMPGIQRKMNDHYLIIAILVERLGGEVVISGKDIAKALLEDWVLENGPAEDRNSFYIKTVK